LSNDMLRGDGPGSGPTIGEGLYTLVATVRNELPYLLEWVAYHRLIGFDHFVFFSNDNTDGTGVLLDALAAAGVCEHYDNTLAALERPAGVADHIWNNPQLRAYYRALRMSSVRASAWVMFLDIDEFVRLNDQATIQQFCLEASRADSISIPWRIFGSAGATDFRPHELVTTRYGRCSKPSFRMNGLVKTIARPSAIRETGGAHMVDLQPGATAVYSDLEPFDGYFHVRNRMHVRAQVNHYAVKSLAEYFMKRSRGDVVFEPENGASVRKYDLSFFYLHDRNEIEDSSLRDMGQAIRGVINTLLVANGVEAAYNAGLTFWRDELAARREVVADAAQTIANARDFEEDLQTLHRRVMQMASHGSPATILDRLTPFPRHITQTKLTMSMHDFLSAINVSGRVLVLEPTNAFVSTTLLNLDSNCTVTCIGGRQERFATSRERSFVQVGRLHLIPGPLEEFKVENPEWSADVTVLETSVSEDRMLETLFQASDLTRDGGRIVIFDYTAFSVIAARPMRKFAEVNFFLGMSDQPMTLRQRKLQIETFLFDPLGHHAVSIRKLENLNLASAASSSQNAPVGRNQKSSLLSKAPRLAVLGTSNAVMRDGYATALRESPNISIFDNFSVGYSGAAAHGFFVVKSIFEIMITAL